MPVRRNLVAQSKWHIKAPFAMVAKMVTFHNTDNEVSAWNEIAYMVRNDLLVSYHIATDEKENVQGLPFNRNGWHCGDGRNGYGNRNTIGWEICRNYDRSRRTTNLIDPLRYMYTQAEQNAIKSAPAVFEELGLVANVNTVKKHQDWNGKNCPSKILNEARWNAFQAAVIHSYNQYMNKGDVSGTVHEVKRGDTLSAIARAYEIQLSDLIKENGIKNPDVISLGQKITIPVSAPTAKPAPKPTITLEEAAVQIANGQGNWGNNPERRQKLQAEGLDAAAVQRRVNQIIEERNKPQKKPWREVALEISNGQGGWGNGDERRRKLTAEGYDAAQIQTEVNRIIAERTARPTVIVVGDRVTASRLYGNAFTGQPARTTPITAFVETVDSHRGWTNNYRLTRTKGSTRISDVIGFARRSDLKKV